MVTARRLNALEVTDLEIDSPMTVDEPIRQVAAAELVAAVEQEQTVVALPALEPGIELERPQDYALLPDVSESDRATG